MLLDAASQRTWEKMLYFRSTVQSRCLQLPAARVTPPPNLGILVEASGIQKSTGVSPAGCWVWTAREGPPPLPGNVLFLHLT